MAWVTGCYLAYLALPIVLLIVGSIGEIWLNTLLPHGLTGRWYLDVWSDGSFRRAFVVSLEVAAATCLVTALIGLPLAYGIYGAGSRGVRAAARLLALLPIAVPPLEIGRAHV